MSRYPDEDFDDFQDRVTREAIQLEVDDNVEAKRNAAQISPEILSLQDAFAEGVRAGGFGHGASMNPYQDNTPEHHEWNRGRLSAIGAALNNTRRAA